MSLNNTNWAGKLTAIKKWDLAVDAYRVPEQAVKFELESENHRLSRAVLACAESLGLPHPVETVAEAERRSRTERYMSTRPDIAKIEPVLMIGEVLVPAAIIDLAFLFEMEANRLGIRSKPTDRIKKLVSALSPFLVRQPR